MSKATLEQINDAIDVANEHGATENSVRQLEKTKALFDDNQILARAVMCDSPTKRDHKDAKVVLIASDDRGCLVRVSFTKNEAMTFARNILSGVV